MLQAKERNSTQRVYRVGGKAETRTYFSVSGSGTVRRKVKRDEVKDKAVLSYLKTLRSLGKTRVSASEVARALEISEREAISILSSLGSKGVKAK